MIQRSDGDNKSTSKPMTAISLSHAKKTMLDDNMHGTEHLPDRQADGEPNRDFPSDYEFRTTGGSIHNIQTYDKGQAVVSNAGEMILLQSQKEMETDS